MIVVLKNGTKPEQIDNLKAWLKSMGIDTHMSVGVNHTIVGLVEIHSGIWIWFVLWIS